MAVMVGPRIRDNNVFGTVADSPLTSGATTLNSSGLANLSAVSSAHAILVIDPLRSAGAPEIVVVTAHTGSATSATVTRGAYGTSARQHAAGVLWVHAPTIDDVIRIVTSSTRPSDQYEGQFIYETDTNKLVGFGGVDWAPRDAGGQIGYAQVTASQTGISTDTDLTGLSSTVTVGTGRRVRISASGLVSRTAVDGTTALYIKESTTKLQIINIQPNIANEGAVAFGHVVLSPSAGAHTYKLSLELNTGTGTTGLAAGATFPASILVEDIGAA